MSTWDKQTLRTRVLTHLGVLGAGQDASAEDQAIVDDAIDASHAQLRTELMAPFKITKIPEYAQLPLRDYVASKVADSFGMNSQRKMELAQGREMAKSELRAQLYNYTSTHVETNYF